MARARVRRVGADLLRGEAQRVRVNGGHRHRGREGGLILAPLHARAGPSLRLRVGQDRHVEVRLAESAAQCCGEGCCGRRVLLALPPVHVRDGAKACYAEPTEAVQ